MEVNIFLLPLLGGYIFIKKSTWFRYRTIRYNAQELILSSAVAGLIGVSIAFLIATTISLQLPDFYSWWKSNIHFDFLGTALLAFLLLITSGIIPNRWIDEEARIKEIIKEDNDGIELILLRALEDAKLVSITLKSRKVYIGFISQNFFNPWTGVKSIKVIPVYSGYRVEKNFRIKFTTSYDTVIKYTVEDEEIDLDINDFQMGIPISEIVTVNIFDPRVYEQFAPPEKSDSQ
ncbi:MAG: hypothetical protein WD604_07890 [Balneolaceae bacterium]